jgi:hypothetical protein
MTKRGELPVDVMGSGTGFRGCLHSMSYEYSFGVDKGSWGLAPFGLASHADRAQGVTAIAAFLPR